MIAKHLPVLLVIGPLLTSLVVMLLPRRPMVSWTMTVAVTTSVLVGSLALLRRVLREGTQLYELGGWTPPMGIGYRVDELNALFLVLVSGVAAVVTWQGKWSLLPTLDLEKVHLFYSVYLLCLTGLLGIVITGDAFNVYVLLEVSSLSTYALVAMGPHRRARLAGFNYLILGSLGATFVLLGLGYLHVMTGTLDMVEMSQRLAPLADSTAVRAGIAFLVVGFLLKGAVFPLHAWLPDAYCEAPTGVAAMLSGTATKVGLYALARFLYCVLGIELSFSALPIDELLLLASAAAMILGSWMALRQTDLKRLLAYSSVAQVGYITLGLGLVDQAGLVGSLAHALHHGVVKAGLFLTVAALAFRLGSTELSSLRGLSRRMPVTSGLLLVGLLGLVGMPLTTGFLSKLYLARSLFATDRILFLVPMALGSLLAAAYAWRVIRPVFFDRVEDGPDREEASAGLLVPAAVLLSTSLVFGLWPTPFLTAVQAAADRLLAGF
ncbi:MAG: monovalent cation/H+ antiporter subunit D family protein [Acidobacteriota bacterium]